MIKIKQKITVFNVVLSIFLLAAITVSIIKVVQSAALNPGHAWSTLDDAPLPTANGGTNANMTLANGGVIYSTASALGVSLAGSTGQILQSAGAAAPTWTTATFPATAGTLGYVLTSDGTNWTSAAAAGGNDPRIVTKALSAGLTNSGTTFAKVTNLDQVVGVGTWAFKYLVMYRSDTTTTGIKFAVNHTGTVTSFVANGRYQENTTAAATGAADQVHITFGLVAGGATRSKSATTALVQTASVDTINVDMLMVIEGLMVVTVSGNIELYSAGEAATVTTVMKDSSLILTKIQ